MIEKLSSTFFHRITLHQNHYQTKNSSINSFSNFCMFRQIVFLLISNTGKRKTISDVFKSTQSKSTSSTSKVISSEVRNIVECSQMKKQNWKWLFYIYHNKKGYLVVKIMNKYMIVSIARKIYLTTYYATIHQFGKSSTKVINISSHHHKSVKQSNE